MDNFKLPLKILYETSEYLIIDKPSCIHSVKSSNSNNLSVADLIDKQFSQYSNSSLKKEDCGLVNRLDYETSGCLILAKNKDSWLKIHNKLKSGEVEKTYEALLIGEFKEESTIESWIGNPNRGSKKVISYKHEVGKKYRALYAKSHFIPIKYNISNNTTLVEVKTNTGRRHQVRVHAKDLGYPLWGDKIYGEEVKDEVFYLRCKEISPFYGAPSSRSAVGEPKI